MKLRAQIGYIFLHMMFEYIFSEIMISIFRIVFLAFKTQGDLNPSINCIIT